MLATSSSPTFVSLRLRRGSSTVDAPFPAATYRRRRQRPISCSTDLSSPAAPPAHDRTFSFAAGPASLPQRVALKAQTELANCAGVAAGSAAEKVARRKHDLAAAIARAESALRRLMHIPTDYAVLFLPGGVTSFFHAVPLNLCSSTSDAAAYVVTGTWSERAYEAAAPHCRATVAWTGQPYGFDRLPAPAELRPSPGARFVHVCADEPVQGLEFKREYPAPAGQETVLVADMSANFCSKPVDVEKFGMIYAGAQASVGPAGLTVAVVRRGLLGGAQAGTPAMLDLAAHAAGAATLCNSPSPAAIYLCALVFEDLLDRGGLEAVQRRNQAKADVIYDVIDGSGGFYVCHVADRDARSAMNAPFVLARRDLEKKFVAEAHLAGIADLSAHGGAVAVAVGAPPGVAGAQRLAAFMKEFQARHQRPAEA
ncbi:phosphoserine aminotransferase 1, chloroplastic-like [Wolffia australiana]